MNRSVLRKDAVRLVKTIAAAFLMALITNVFLKVAGLVPGGINGLSLLIQRVVHDRYGVELSYTIVNLLLNAGPAIAAFLFVGKKFVFFSVLMVVLTSVFVDFIPQCAFTDDMLLITVFGGIAYGFAISIVLNANASSGGTDFIAMILANKYNISMWNYLLAFNAAIIAAVGTIYGVEKAMYSIVFQVFSTQVVNHLHKRYQRKTIFLITKNPDRLAEELMRQTNHGVTSFEGIGCYSGKKRYLLYMVTSKADIPLVKRIVHQTDPTAFMNIADSKHLTGNFYLEPMD